MIFGLYFFLGCAALRVESSLAFVPLHSTGDAQSVLLMKLASDDDTPQTIDPLSKTSWYVVEAFGNVFGSRPKETEKIFSLEVPPQSLKETLKRIQDDFDRSYFLSGEVDSLIYDPDCVFSDPFVSFSGTERFVRNLANLGSFITKYSVKSLEMNSDDPLLVKTKVMVKLELALPWRPVLAWPWGVDYTIDSETFLITNHRETWDIEPLEGVKQIFRKPTTKV